MTIAAKVFPVKQLSDTDKAMFYDFESNCKIKLVNNHNGSYTIQSSNLNNNQKFIICENDTFDDIFRSLKVFSMEKTITNLKTIMFRVRRKGELSKKQARLSYSFVIKMIEALKCSTKKEYMELGYNQVDDIIDKLYEFHEVSKSDIKAIKSIFVISGIGFCYPVDVQILKDKHWLSIQKKLIF